jgi:hypothetical protein
VRESAFDRPPTTRVIVVVLRQFPYRVQMIGENSDGLNLKGIFSANHTECFAQQIRVFNQQT